MKKTLFVSLLLVVLTVLVVGPLFASGQAESSDQKTVGIAMPTQSSARWIGDGNYMKQILEDRGYKVDLQYAEDNIDAQVSQLKT